MEKKEVAQIDQKRRDEQKEDRFFIHGIMVTNLCGDGKTEKILCKYAVPVAEYCVKTLWK